MNKATKFIKNHIAALLILAVVIAVPFGVSTAKYTSTNTVAENIEVKVQLDYVLDKASLQQALKELSGSAASANISTATLLADTPTITPTSINFVAGTDSRIAGLTSVTDGVQGSGSEKIGIFVSGTDVYIAPMNTSKQPANSAKPIYAPADCSYFLSNSETGLGGSVTSISCANLDTSKTTDFRYMFEGFTALTSLDIGTLNTSAATDISHMFKDCSALEVLDLTSVNTAAVTTASGLFYGCKVLQTVTLGANFKFVGEGSYLTTPGNADVAGASGKWYETQDSSTEYTAEQLAAYHNTSGAAHTYKAARSYTLDKSALHATLQTLAANNPTTLKVTTGSAVPTGLTSAGSASAAGSGVIGVFFDAGSSTIYVAPADNTDSTSIVYAPEDSSYLFAGGTDAEGSSYTGLASTLTSISLNNLDTSEVSSMEHMFYKCGSVSALNLSGFDTSNTASMSDMFAGSTALVTLDLSSFKVSDAVSLSDMFNGCSGLTTIYASTNFAAGSAMGGNMFEGCQNLVGGEGTTYDSSHTDGTYARIDDPTNGKPGYFTKKSS